MLPHLSPLKETSLFDVSTIIALCVFFALLCACIIVGHLLEENRWANESIVSLILGLCAGGVVLLVTGGKNSKLLVFSENLFFLYLLPPIIFNAGFQVKKKQFFKNITIILLFGALGTVISFSLISIGSALVFNKIGLPSFRINDYLAVGAIMSATDSVCTLQVLNQEETPFLYSVVFGEGVVNDATSIVLFNAVQTLRFDHLDWLSVLSLFGTFLYLFFTSTVLGIVFGLLCAFIIKTLYFGRHSTDREVALMMLMAYLSYLISELLNLSGILTVFFCGIVMSHYTWHNVTESSRSTTRHGFAAISFIAETFIFLYVGIDAFDVDTWKGANSSVATSLSVSASLVALVMVGRAAFIFPLAGIFSFFKKRESQKVDLRQQFTMWWAGLMRGAVTIALSYNQFSSSSRRAAGSSSEYDLMLTSTMIVVLFSTVVFGSITKPLIEWLLLRNLRLMSSDAIEIASLEDLRLLLNERDVGEGRIGTTPSRLRLLMTFPTTTVHYWWRKFDDAFMRPVFGGRGFVPRPPPGGEAENERH